MPTPLRIAMLGTGFMGRAHSNAWLQVGHFFDHEHKPMLKVCCGREDSGGKTRKFAETWGYEAVECDWRTAIARKDVDLIDICYPNHLHKEIVLAAAREGKMIVCEKPLAM